MVKKEEKYSRRNFLSNSSKILFSSFLITPFHLARADVESFEVVVTIEKEDEDNTDSIICACICTCTCGCQCTCDGFCYCSCACACTCTPCSCYFFNGEASSQVFREHATTNLDSNDSGFVSGVPSNITGENRSSSIGYNRSYQENYAGVENRHGDKYWY